MGRGEDGMKREERERREEEGRAGKRRDEKSQTRDKEGKGGEKRRAITCSARAYYTVEAYISYKIAMCDAR